MNANPVPRPTPNPPSDFQWELDENGDVVITGLASQDATEVVVPAEIDGCRVAAICDRAFYECKSLTSVALPSSVQEIGGLAFADCSSDLTLYGAAGSVAEKYAEEKGLRFEAR